MPSPRLLDQFRVGKPLAGLRLRRAEPGDAGPDELTYPIGGVILNAQGGRELLVVAVRATFDLASGKPHDPQQAISTADVYEGEELVDPSDYAVARTGTSIIVRGDCCFAGAASRRNVSFRVGEASGSWLAMGVRTWREEPEGAWRTTLPMPAVSVPLTYRAAYGGVGVGENPVGRGLSSGAMPRAGDELPQIVRLNEEEVLSPSDFEDRALRLVPMPLPLSPAWLPRRSMGGTYDEAWARTRAPFLPDDTSDAFGDVVHPSWVHRPWLRGGEAVEWVGLGSSRFGEERTDDAWSGRAWLPRIDLRLTGPFRREFPLRCEITRFDFVRSTISMTYACRLDVTGQLDALPRLTVVQKSLEKGTPSCD